MNAFEEFSLATEEEIIGVVSLRWGRQFRAVHTLADRPGECRVLDLESEGERLVAKAAADGRSRFRYAQLQRLWTATRACQVLKIAEPYFVDVEADIVVTSLLPARAAHHVPSLNDATQIGRALAELHSLGADEGAVTATVTDDVASLVRPAPTDLARELPRHAKLIGQAVELLLSVEIPSHVTRVHRDFHLRQVLIARDGVGVVDWDDAANGDPAFDVAYFLTYLETHHHCLSLSDAFMLGYREAVSTPQDDKFEFRLADYRIFNLLRRAARRSRVRDAGWEDELERMLHELGLAMESRVAA